jgi:Uncharacterized protein related to deoxyribodipyrimidine photolyase
MRMKMQFRNLERKPDDERREIRKTAEAVRRRIA